MKGRHIPYSTTELKWIAARAAQPRAALHAQFVATFGRDDVNAANFKALCTRNGWKTGRDGRFPPGLAPHNKGKPFNHPGSAATRFKKGQQPHNTNYLGHERTTYDGYTEISVDEQNPYTGFERRYVLKHLWQWQKIHGPLPAGHCLKCLDGNRQNTDPANWQAIPRAMLPRLSGRYGRQFETAPAEIKPTILAVAKLEHAARERRKPKKEIRT